MLSSKKMHRLGFSVGLAVAAPMLFPGCEGIKQEAKSPVVVIDIPKSMEPITDGMRDERKAPVRLSTVLNISSYNDKVLEARLSVVNPDNTLERVVLDPKVTFYLKGDSSWEIIPGCIDVFECGIPHAGTKGKQSSMVFKADFIPSNGDSLKPSVSEPLFWEPGQSERTVQ